jgi:hypothetical protein
MAIGTLPGGQPGAPVSGIVTSVRVWHTGSLARGAVRLMRAEAAGMYRNVEEQAVIFPNNADSSKASTYSTRFKANPGDRIGIGWATVGSESMQIQYVSSGTSIAATGTSVPYPVGTTLSFSNLSNAIAVNAVLEADADGDGYGDESQDACPTNAAVQVACPAPPKPLVFMLPPGTQKYSKLAVTQSVTADSTVSTTATVKLGKKSYSTKPVAKSLKSGTAAVFKFSFTSAGKKAIAKYLKSHASVKATVVSLVSNGNGSDTSKLTVKLKK